jgi:hypothetical protein
MDGGRDSKLTKEDQLAQLSARIQEHADWWLFPSEKLVRGFMGTDPLFIVGDQPSTSIFPPNNPNRRAFYDLLARLGVPNAHVTDLYKKRGPVNTLASCVPSDFEEHKSIFRQELAALEPTRVIALGKLAFKLLEAHVPEIVPRLTYMWHFAYAQRFGRISGWEEMARKAVWAPLAVAPKPGSRTGTTGVLATSRKRDRNPPGPFLVPAPEHSVTYKFSRLCFKAEIIEPLQWDQTFCVVSAGRGKPDRCISGRAAL